MAAQLGQAIIYDTTFDRGGHAQPCVVPMYNNVIMPPARALSNNRWSPMRVSNEHAIGLVPRWWSYLNAWHLHSVKRQPLGLFYLVGVLLTNCITCLDHNQVSGRKAFRCAPPTLEQYLQ